MNGERMLYRTKEAFEDVLRNKEEKPLGELANAIFSSRSKYERFASVLLLFKGILPKEGLDNETIKKLFYNTEHLSFSKDFEFEETNIGNSGNTGQARVYVLKSKSDKPSQVIKIFRPDIKSIDTTEFSIKLKHERDEIEKLYASVPDLVPKEHYLVMEDPFKKERPAAIVIEEFLGGETMDIFSFSLDQLVNLTKENTTFKDQLMKFIKVTLENELVNGNVVDILGPKNLIAVHQKDGSFRLILLDPHGVIKTKEVSEDKRTRAKKKLDFLRQVLAKIEAN